MRNHAKNKTPAEATTTAQAPGEGKPPRQAANGGKDLYQAVTDQIIEAMDAGLFSTGALWNRAGEGAGGLPVNHSTGVTYSWSCGSGST